MAASGRKATTANIQRRFSTQAGADYQADYYTLVGMQTFQSGSTANVTVMPGNVMDFTNTTNLSLSTPVTISLTSSSNVATTSNLEDTITSAATAVTSDTTSAAFTRYFSTAATNTDLSNQYTFIGQTLSSVPTIIGISGTSATVASVTDDNNLTTNSNLGASGSNYFRGGVLTTGAGTFTYGIMVTYDGSSTTVYATSFTPEGLPDLPSGVISYRVIALVTASTSDGVTYTMTITQPMPILPPLETDTIAYSTSTITPTVGQYTWTIPSTKFFPIGGQVLIEDEVVLGNHYFGIIVAYSGTSLVINILSTFGTGVASSEWGIFLITGPTTALAPYQMTGLQLSQSGTSATINVASGSVRDYGNTIDLVLSSATSIDLSSTSKIVQVSLAGTISSVGNAVTGSGTAFNTDFSINGSLTDLDNQKSNFGYAIVIRSNSIIATSAQSAQVTIIGGDTSITSGSANLGAGAGTAYFRGGPVNTNNTLNAGQGLRYGIVLTRKDSDGTVSVYATSFTNSGNPDLPSGYTYYRVIGFVDIYYTSKYNVVISQPMNVNPLNTQGDMLYFQTDPNISLNTRLPIGSAGQVLTVVTTDISNGPAWSTTLPQHGVTPTAVYSATITPTALSGTVNAVSVANSLITMTTSNALVTGQSLRFVSPVPAGITAGQHYYVGTTSGNPATFALYTTLSNAQLDSSRVAYSTSTTGATVVRLVPSNEFNVGFASVGAVVGTPGTNGIGFDYNLSNALATTTGVVDQYLYKMTGTSGVLQTSVWYPSTTPTFNSTTLVQSSVGWNNPFGGATSGSWPQVGTTGLTITVKIWG